MAAIAPPKPGAERPPQTGTGGGDGGRETPRGYDGEEPGGGAPVSDRRYYTGMYLGLGGIVMLFTAFTSAYVVRKGLSDDWRPLRMPTLAWFNTLVLLASSVTLEKARRAFPQMLPLRRWWVATTLLGGLFLVGQVWIWRQLAADGIYLSSNPSSSFFYLLTAAHGVHLLGGVTALLWLTWKLWRGLLTRTAAGVMSIYWHFMDALWIYLLLLLLFWQ